MSEPAPEILRVETRVSVAPVVAWDAVKDVFHVHERLVPGLVVDVKQEDDVRIVTFANGFVVKERILQVDEDQRRIVYSAFGGRTTTHRSTLRVLADGNAVCLVWITEFLPAEVGPFIQSNMEAGINLMKRTLESVGD